MYTKNLIRKLCTSLLSGYFLYLRTYDIRLWNETMIAPFTAETAYSKRCNLYSRDLYTLRIVREMWFFCVSSNYCDKSKEMHTILWISQNC